MESPAGSLKKELPKRDRNPPKKIRFYEPDPGSPKDDQNGHFVFLTFEDGYTAKIFNVTDILNKNDQSIASLRNLKPGEVVLARWSDNKFYSATVNYVGTEAKKVDAKKGTKKDIKKRDTAAQRFYNRSSLPPAVQSTSAQQCLNSVEHGVTQQPATPQPTPTPPPLPHYQPPATPSTPPSLPRYQPPATQSSPSLPRYQPPATQSSPSLPRYQPPANQSSPSLPLYQPPATQSSPSLPLYQPLATQSSSPLLPYYHLSDTPSQYQPLFIQPLQNYPLALSSNHPQYPQHHQSHTTQPMSFNKSQQMPVLTNSAEQWKPTTPSKLAAKESFLKMLYSPIIPETPSACPTEKSTASSSEYENSSFSSSAASSINEIAPVPDYGEPSVRTKPSGDGAWKPCEACKPELTKLIEENEKLEEVLCSIGGEQLEALKSFLEKVEQIQPQAGVMATKNRSGKQELYPESGLFLSSTRLAAIHAEAQKDCLHLFHLLFDEFFTAEECQNAVAFGKHGKVPEGKQVLDKAKVNGILTYIMRCGTLDGWTPVEKSKAKKALINKCRMRASKTS